MANVIPTVALVTRCFKKQRGWLMGIALTGGAVGSIIAAPVITKLIAAYDWRTAYLIIGITVLVLVAIAALILRDPLRSSQTGSSTNASPAGPASAERGISLHQAVRSRVFWILVIVFLSSIFTQQVVVVHIIPHATDVGVSPLVAATVVSVIYGVNSAGNLTGGRVVDLIGSRLAMIIGLSLLLVSLLIILVARQAWTFYVFAVFFGLAWGAIITLRFSMIAEFFGLRSLGAITGAFMLISNLGSAVSPVIAGYIFDVTGSYRLGFLILTGICIFGLVIAVMLKLQAARYPAFGRV
jgi:MFS family permease